MRNIFILLICCCSLVTNAQSTITFQSLDEVFVYAGDHSSVFKNNTQESILARYQTIAAKVAKWNLQASANLSATDNTKLNSTFIPAEIFGGPAGTFRTVSFGQRYVSNATVAPQFDILNPYTSAKVKVSKVNEQVTAVANLISRRDLYLSIAGSYYNIKSYQWQIEVTEKSLANADTLLRIMENKQQEGIARPQDVNSASASRLSVLDKLQQLKVQLAQENNNLKIFCDIDTSVEIHIDAAQKPDHLFETSLNATGDLLRRQNEWQVKYQEQTLKADKKWFLPTLGFFSSFGWQQNTNDHFFDSSRWIGSNYVGLRLTIPLFPDAAKIAAVRYDRVNLQMAQNNWKHAILEEDLNNRQYLLDYQKAFTSYELSSKIAGLNGDSYQKNLSIYKEGILSATDLLNSFNEWLNSGLNAAAQLANSEYAKSKITIYSIIK